MILQVVHISGTRMIETRIDGLYRGNNLGGLIGLEPLKFFPLVKGATEISDNLEPWLRSWWGYTLTPLYVMGWFDEEQRGNVLSWTPLLAAMETDLDLMLEARLKRPYKTHIVVIPHLMKLLWRIKMGKEADLLLTITVGIPF